MTSNVYDDDDDDDDDNDSDENYDVTLYGETTGGATAKTMTTETKPSQLVITKTL